MLSLPIKMQMIHQGSSSSSFSNKWTYDVFLSFRGQDTRTGFTGNLFNALSQRGIHTFMDHAELKRGEEIMPSLLKAIEESRISIVVFSENYASSRSCLDELVTILDCIKAKGRLVLPIFYMVDPSQVKYQTGSYGEALAKYEGLPNHEPQKVQKWRSALSKAANLSGYHYEHKAADLSVFQFEHEVRKAVSLSGKEFEYEFIRRIVKDVSSKINRIPLYIVDYPVGLESRILKVTLLLDLGSDDGVNMIGIFGIGGIGKSTVARAIYNLIADGFESLCFLSNIREKSIKQGLTQLQETLLFELTGESNIKLGDVNRGIPILKCRLNRKKVLIVLDDVDKVEQLQALAGGVDWFGSGSRIIITTRDTHLLSVHSIERGYDVEELNHKEAYELFNWKAFKSGEADPNFRAISERAVLCGHGLPLALEVIGSNLYGKGINECKSALDRYEENSDEQVQEVLRVSYNSLKEDEKEIFLDIACFFNGETLQHVKTILSHARGFSPDYAIGVLIEKSLIKINRYLEEKVEIHHLIQDMGRKIVQQESSSKPGNRSRLWFHEDIVQVLEEDKGTDKIQFIKLDLVEHEVGWNGNGFKKMRNLRVLVIKDAKFSQGANYLPNSLRVLHWKGYPSPCLPYDFQPKKLLILNLHDSFFAWDKPLKMFQQLSRISFVGCKFLKQVPDTSEAPNLTELIIDFCMNLTEIHDSIGFLDKLRVISARSCVNLKTFPRIFKLTSLEMLDLSDCLSLQYFPEIFGHKEKLSYISVSYSAIEELPCSIQNVTGLNLLDLSFCQRLKKVPTCILMLPKLETLHVGNGSSFEFIKKCGEQENVSSTDKWISLRGCNFLDGFLPTFLGCFQNLICLKLGYSDVTIIPACIENCKFLSHLILDNCKHLREIKGIPPEIEVLSARNCISLMPSTLDLLLNPNIHSDGNTDFTLPRTIIPEWFDHYDKGASLSFWFRGEFPNIALFVSGCAHNMFDSLLLECSVCVNGCERGKWIHQFSELETQHTFVYDLGCQLNKDQLKWVYPEQVWNHAEISYVFQVDPLNESMKPWVQWTGVYVYDRTRIKSGEILFTIPHIWRHIITFMFAVILAVHFGSPSLVVFLICILLILFS